MSSASFPGSDPQLRNEAVIIGAHLDHLGKRDRYVFNGADDNASGAAGVLEIARAVASMPQRPKRSMVFCLWTGEELNLLGSTFYAGRPAFPLERTAAYLNLDMIGRAADETGLAARLKKLKIPEQDQKDDRSRQFRGGRFRGRARLRGDPVPGRPVRRPRSLAESRGDGKKLGDRQRLPSLCPGSCSLYLLGGPQASGLSPDRRQPGKSRP